MEPGYRDSKILPQSESFPAVPITCDDRGQPVDSPNRLDRVGIDIALLDAETVFELLEREVGITDCTANRRVAYLCNELGRHINAIRSVVDAA